ncbi:hypothetical protein [Arthrobacter ruber]|uniref:hypothetical protein n=1 Tax=Arthrobacter ruber TaxID=1258893 RepID=UPI001F0C5760|nr:hypothetical protein [Arthrobacter ruber]
MSGSFGDPQQTCQLGCGGRIRQIRAASPGAVLIGLSTGFPTGLRAGLVIEELVFEKYTQFLGGGCHIGVDAGFLGVEGQYACVDPLAFRPILGTRSHASIIDPATDTIGGLTNAIQEAS